VVFAQRRRRIVGEGVVPPDVDGLARLVIERGTDDRRSIPPMALLAVLFGLTEPLLLLTR
jgi:hypothetical protein